MHAAKLLVHQAFIIDKVDRRIFGSFVEHLGRAVYGGIYEPTHPDSDLHGFRNDVLAMTKELNVSIVRYPGGNFVSQYNWLDGVGPREQRPVRTEVAWSSIEPNRIGTNEFCDWASAAGCEIMMAVNLGTGSPNDARNLVEYCNLEKGTSFSDLRRSHGYEKPHQVKLRCLGNEMDGMWQIGCKSAKEYGVMAREAAKVMKAIDPSIELVACGSSALHLPTFGQWELEVLEESYKFVDYISLHTYLNAWSQENRNFSADTEGFLASVSVLSDAIHTISSVCDYVKARKHGKKTIHLSFDEWNVWFHSIEQDKQVQKWQIAPPLLEDVYTFEDALVVGTVLITILNHVDRVKIACLAQLVNVIAPISTQNNGPAIRQTIFHPFALVSKYGRGIVLRGMLHCDKYTCNGFSDVNRVDAAVVWNEEKQEVCVFAINKSAEESCAFEVDLQGFDGYSIDTHHVLEHEDVKACNTFDAPENVMPHRNGVSVMKGSHLEATLPRLSFHVVVLTKRGMG